MLEVKGWGYLGGSFRGWGYGAGGSDDAFGGMAAQGGGRKVGYCVIGLGTIADHFMRGCRLVRTRRLPGW